MKKHIFALPALFILAPFAAQAEDTCCLNMSYTFVEAFYAHAEIDEDASECGNGGCLLDRIPWPWTDGNGLDDADGDGYRVNGSLGVFDHGFVFGNYTDISFDDSVDGTRYNIGGGLNHQIFELPVDGILKVGYVDAELDTDDGDIDDSGYSVGAGLRAPVGGHVEVEGGFTYYDLDAPFEDTVFNLGARVYLTDDWALSAGTEFDEGFDSPAYLVGVRYEFGRYRAFSDRSEF